MTRRTAASKSTSASGRGRSARKKTARKTAAQRGTGKKKATRKTSKVARKVSRKAAGTKKKTRRKTRSRRPDPGRVGAILAGLAVDYPEPRCALNHDNPLQLLVATILSAQCTDERVNMVTADLFRKYRSAADFADSPPGELEEDIRSTGFFNSKAKNIRGACRLLVDRHDGIVPDQMDELLELPGVARKTANVVLGTAFGITSGVVVDTHVKRITNLLHLTAQQDPVKIEQELMQIVPETEWVNFSHRVIWHGRKVCIARRPRCSDCRIREHCPSAQAS